MRPSKKEIKESLDRLKDKSAGSKPPEVKVGKLSEKKSSQRIRKQGV
jgi:hypothetical protein